MKLIVGINKVTFDETDRLNAGEYNIHDVEFEFDEVYTNLVKKAVFSGNGHNYLVDIINNKCVMPYEVLSETGDVTIGAYGYTVEDEELVLRYSPSPTYIHVDMGSYKDNYDNYQVPTADVVEQLEQEINNKQDILVSGTNIKTINNQSILGEGNINIQGGGVDIEAGENIYFTEDQDKTVINAVDTIYDDTEIKQDISDLETNKADKSEIPDVSGFITKNVNDLTYYTLKTSTGSLIDLEINSSTYVVTLSLKDIDGNVISSDTIDLPLESVVVSGSFDSTNKKIVLTLQNGNTVDIPVGDLVAGLQTEITSSNKLASDLVDDSNSGNKFVTTSEKTAWNAKYDKPSGGIPATDLASGVIPDLTNYIQKSQTSGLVKNDGTIDTNNYMKVTSDGVPVFDITLTSFSCLTTTTPETFDNTDLAALGTLLTNIKNAGYSNFALLISNVALETNKVLFVKNDSRLISNNPSKMNFIAKYIYDNKYFETQLKLQLSYSSTVGVLGLSQIVKTVTNLATSSDLTTKEDTTNKVTSISSSSTDTQYPSAKCIYDIVGDIATTLDTIQGEVI